MVAPKTQSAVLVSMQDWTRLTTALRLGRGAGKLAGPRKIAPLHVDLRSRRTAGSALGSGSGAGRRESVAARGT
jgi:hypothetical protein